ncbi:MAG: transcription termination/antitermination protein NusA [Ruminococcus sp.]|uniref:transcription termination factor NusA n=1 Tax=Ruminococcus sp. TaxID=41978 RepID=UPI0025CE36C2|nr:transcription termination factor NusA [Ruminococcus sp.]MBR6996375.1 transcription termination/antitermination protein NusA [Ruminococcus sp.]
MNMNKDFFKALEALGEENSVETELLIDKVKSAMLKAARRAYPHSEERISVEIDPKTKKFEMYIRQDIIDDEPIDVNEVNIDVAKTMDPNAVVGGTILKELDISKLGRMAALSAKQSIKGDLREINREQMLSKFEQKEHECITAKVSQVEPGRGTVTVVYDGTELYLFRNEQIPGENLEEGKSVKVYITGIIGKNKKPVVKISRTHKDLVKRLFEQEVPEIYDGTVEVKSISREAGSRTKIAVWSKDENVDAVGACIGPKRSRITAVVNELSGEKIDIIPWSEVPEEFIARALAPAEVLKTVITSMEEKACTVIVPNNQLSLAIGNKGQNAKLAAKLTGFKIDIKPQFDNLTGEEAPEMSPDFVAPVFETAPVEEEESTEAAAEETAPEETAPEEAEEAKAEEAEAEEAAPETEE